MKVAVGLSGGVDSSVACYLLKQEGHEVTGLTMKLWDSAMSATVKRSACFGPDEADDIEDAAAFAAWLGIPFHVIDLSKEYWAGIIGYFRNEYAAGRTPNPCMRCNRSMKFGLLIDKALASGISFEKFATGHYARVLFDAARKRHILLQGLDPKKDQSYFLGLLGQDQLARIILPLGAYKKDHVKEIARSLGLKAYAKKESQDFYSGEYGELLDDVPSPGTIVDSRGNVLGTHRGIFNYTIGQRRGLGVSGKSPLYVTDIDSGKNTVTLGPDAELFRNGLIVTDPNWIGIERLTGPMHARVKIRSTHGGSDATISPQDDAGCVKVEFDEPQRAVTPGQYAVFYENATVIGAGVIDRSISA